MTSTRAAERLDQAAFVTTHWTQVAQAAGTSGAENDAALEQLCRAYWYPLYAYVRRQGHEPEEAQDLTQAFFARLLQKRYLSHANPNRGRFRTFLLSSMQRFLVNEWQKSSARKRGGGIPAVSWHEEETRYRADGCQADTPEKLFEKRWALALLESVLARLQAEAEAAGKSAQFSQLKLLLWGDNSGPAQGDIAPQLGLSAGALKVALHRLRKRYRELLRAEIARTVASPAEVDEELRYLISVLSA